MVAFCGRGCATAINVVNGSATRDVTSSSTISIRRKKAWSIIRRSFGAACKYMPWQIAARSSAAFNVPSSLSRRRRFCYRLAFAGAGPSQTAQSQTPDPTASEEKMSGEPVGPTFIESSSNPVETHTAVVEAGSVGTAQR